MPRTGRPKVAIDYDVLETMLQYGATCTDCAGRFLCSNDTIERGIKSRYHMTFAELSDKLMHKVRLKLRQKMFESAMNGNTAIMIWLSKQWLGMKEEGLLNINSNGSIVLKIDKQDAGL
jgi:hypothetical protein